MIYLGITHEPVTIDEFKGNDEIWVSGSDADTGKPFRLCTSIIDLRADHGLTEIQDAINALPSEKRAFTL